MNENNVCDDLNLSSSSIVCEPHVNLTQTSKNELKIFHVNARSLTGKLSEFLLLIDQYKVDVFSVTETWFQDGNEHQMAYVTIPSYKLYSSPCKDRVPGGGVAVYVKDSLKVNLCNRLNNLAENKKIEHL